MLTSRSIGVVLLILGVAFFCSKTYSWKNTLADASNSSTSDSSTPKSPLVGKTPFTGKILVIKMAVPFQSFSAMEGATLQQLGNRAFLVGKALDIGNGESFSGRISWHALDLISEITEFENIKEAKKSFPRNLKYLQKPPVEFPSYPGEKE